MTGRFFWLFIVDTLSLVLVIIGGCLFHLLPEIINQKINNNLIITNNSDSLVRFKNPPANVSLRVYFFNVTNADEVKLNKKPKLEELGPYVYRETIVKENIKFLKNGTTVQFDQKKIYTFDRKSSLGSDTDVIYTINLPLTLLPGPCRLNIFCNTIMNTLMADLYSKKLMRKYKVKDLIFGTFEVLQEGSALASFLPSLAFVVNDSIKDNNYQVFTGKSEIGDLNALYSYNHKEELSFWNDKYCDKLNGTDGTQFPPHVDKSQKLYIFTSDLCRSLYFTYEDEADIKGITGYHFTIPKDVFENPEKEPNNMCFCTEAVNNTCPLGSGVLDLSKCRQGAPVFVSAPHFFNADKRYIEAVEGLDPNKKKHESSIYVQKDTGSVLSINKRIQINVNVQPLENYKNLINVSMMFPILWITEHAIIDDETASDFKSKVETPLIVAKIVPPIILSLGLIFFVASLCVYIVLKVRRENYEYFG